jgi:putative transposase
LLAKELRRNSRKYAAPLEIETTSTTWFLERTKEVAMASESAEPIERWTAKRRVALVVSILKGETSVAEAARQHGLTVAEVEAWREKFLLGAENALRSRPKDDEALKDEQIKQLKQKIGDLTHIPCGHDGWGHLAAVIDCHDREVIGYEFALRSRAKEAERAVEAACLVRFGTVRPVGAPVLRSDNGLIFQSRRFRQGCRDYRLQQEFITPYTPEQNGIIERFFRSLKEECVWQHVFETFEEARRIIRDWLHWSQPRAAPSSVGLPEPRPISCPTSNPGGLSSGEHYRSKQLDRNNTKYDPRYAKSYHHIILGLRITIGLAASQRG